jgi:hypothetical protein
MTCDRDGSALLMSAHVTSLRCVRHPWCSGWRLRRRDACRGGDEGERRPRALVLLVAVTIASRLRVRRHHRQSLGVSWAGWWQVRAPRDIARGRQDSPPDRSSSLHLGGDVHTARTPAQARWKINPGFQGRPRIGSSQRSRPTSPATRQARTRNNPNVPKIGLMLTVPASR